MTAFDDVIDFDESYYDFDGNLLWGAIGPIGLASNGHIELFLENDSIDIGGGG